MALINRGEAETLAHLKSLKIEPTIVLHDVVTTVDAWTVALKAKECTAALAKNLFVKGKKGELGLVFALADTKTDMKVIGTTLGAVGGVRFADESLLNSTLGVVQGAVTPLALINDKEKKVQVILDAAVLIQEGPIAVHPCRNDQSVLLSAAEIKNYIQSLDAKIHVVDFAAVAAAAPAPAPAATAGGAKKPEKKEKKPQEKKEKKKDETGVTKLGMDEPKNGDFSLWYSQVITKAEMIEYYDVSGCYIIRPWAYEMWDHVKNFFDAEIKELDVENCYFPMFVSKDALEREKDHVEGFAPEVAWVTKAGSSDLEKPVALRPTSETVMYPVYAKWIRSHRDLPLKLNQWCNVIRWEFSHPTPFIRTREFLWQEGHSAFATKAEADVEVRTILDLYRRVYEECLAVPTVPGVKTEKEKFAGGDYTTTVETYVAQVGRGCQGATSHALGQNFGKMFDISFEDPSGEKDADGKSKKLIPYQNSWGITTRTIGVMTMVHGDDKGMVLPPRVAHFQVVIVPCGLTAKATEEEKEALYSAASALQKALKKGGIRAKADLRDNYTPGWRYNYWELKGVPIRIELGPRELAEKKLVCVRRCDAVKVNLTWDDSLIVEARKLLDNIHDTMFTKALEVRDSKLKQVTEWPEFVPHLNDKCLLMSPWCGDMKCEDAIKKHSAEESKALLAETADDERAPSMGAKSLCIPFNQPKEDATKFKCIHKNCQAKSTTWVMFGRSY